MSAPAPAETVNVYFIEPIKTISVVMDVLIKLNFAVYAVPAADRYRLVPILKQHPRNVVYICLLSETEAGIWLEYIDRITQYEQTKTQFGVFVSSIISQQTRVAFLNRGVATIDLSRMQTNALETLKKILLYFEAREKRMFVKAKAAGVCQVFFKLKNLVNAIKGDLVEISIHAFSCIVNDEDKVFFTPKDYIQDVTLILRGKRIRLSARFMGFNQGRRDVAVFILFYPRIVNGLLEYHQQLPQDIRKTIFDFILIALKDELNRQLAVTEEERPNADVVELTGKG